MEGNKESSNSKRKINTLFIESVKEGIDFGETVLRFLELNSNLDRDAIADNPELLIRELEKTVGSWMARIYERNILQNLCKKLCIDYSEIKHLEFPKAVREAFKKYNQKTSN